MISDITVRSGRQTHVLAADKDDAAATMALHAIFDAGDKDAIRPLPRRHFPAWNTSRTLGMCVAVGSVAEHDVVLIIGNFAGRHPHVAPERGCNYWYVSSGLTGEGADSELGHITVKPTSSPSMAAGQVLDVIAPQ